MTSSPGGQAPDNTLSARLSGFLLKLLGSGGRKLPLALLAAASLALVGYFVFYEDNFSKIRSLRQEKERLESEIGRLEEENRQLRERIERIKTDSGYVEDEARRKLGLVKPGETIYRLTEEPDWQPEEDLERP